MVNRKQHRQPEQVTSYITVQSTFRTLKTHHRLEARWLQFAVQNLSLEDLGGLRFEAGRKTWLVPPTLSKGPFASRVAATD